MILVSTLALLHIVLCALGDYLVVEMARDYFTARIIANGPLRPCSEFSSPICTFVDRVMYNDVVIWETSMGRCSYVSIYKFYEEPCFAELRIENNGRTKTLYLEHFDTGWVERSEMEYLRRVNVFFLCHTFDISCPMVPEMFNVQVYKPFGKTSHIFTPLENFNIRRVVDGNDMLWEGSYGEICALVILHEESSFAHVLIKGKDYYKSLYFAHGTNGWKTIPKKDFYNKLELASGPAARF